MFKDNRKDMVDLIKKMIIALVLVVSILFFGCSGTAKNIDDDQGVATVKKITAKEAKMRLDGEDGIILVDVRTPEEYESGHIPGAILLPIDTIESQAGNVIPDKEATYFIYCRSGNRSATASKMLVEMGYQHIFDLGGIIDWPYEIVNGS